MVEQTGLDDKPSPITQDRVPSGPVVHVAGLWRRLLATIIDLLLLSPALAFLGWIAIRVSGLSLPLRLQIGLESLMELVLEGGGVMVSIGIISLIILALYEILFMTTMGATPGLRLLHLKVISPYGETPEWWRALLRCTGFLASLSLLGLGFLWIGFDREKRGLHDWIAGTYVILIQGHVPD
jgi:uncharacterized RDD family membrane protein YckC